MSESLQVRDPFVEPSLRHKHFLSVKDHHRQSQLHLERGEACKNLSNPSQSSESSGKTKRSATKTVMPGPPMTERFEVETDAAEVLKSMAQQGLEIGERR